MRNPLILHGHFYQPPREDPWTGIVPRQASAGPHENWNTRITRECYAANSASRVLDARGNILDIVNNYAHISFNFGPTLLSWLESHAPTIYSRILEADRFSREERDGHGNAIAQAYNHTILPLSSPEDRRTQVVWGLKDFESRFCRPAEGLWLPETAVSPPVLDVLIEEGVKFIILSPWQAEAYCPVGSQKWKALDGEPVPSHRAYRIDRPGGSLAVFFYNHQLAHGISFEHYLRDADRLHETLLRYRQAARPAYLINVATDGEVYGHHEPFGDMCLAALIGQLRERNELELTNYGQYLAKFPPVYLVRLKSGEGEHGTSWSCSHGVSRWFRDCGCSTGGQPGWNQRWRTPLREALDALQSGLKGVYHARMVELGVADPARARDRYIEVLTGRTPRTTWARAMLTDRAAPGNRTASGREPSREKVERLLTLLEGQRMAMFMFSSCGWFFSDISGIETVQNLAYAVRAIELYSRFTEVNLLQALLEDLELALSNVVENGSGRNIVENQVLPLRQEPAYGAALFVMLEVFREERPLLEPESGIDLFHDETHRGGAESDESGPTWGIFRRESLTLQEDGPRFPECTGTVGVSSVPCLTRRAYSFALRRTAEVGFTLHLTDSATEREKRFDLSVLPERIRRGVLRYLSRNLLTNRCSHPPACLESSLELITFGQNLRLAPPAEVIKLAEVSLQVALEQMLEPYFQATDQRPALEALERLETLVLAARNLGLSFDPDGIARALSHIVSEQSERLKHSIEEDRVRVILRIVDLGRRVGLEVDPTRAQKAVFDLLRSQWGRSDPQLRTDADLAAMKRVRLLIGLASHLGINVERFKEMFFTV